MKIVIRDTKEELSSLIAEKFIKLLKKKPDAVLGLATGSSPTVVYDDLIKAYQKKTISFEETSTFNLDEYLDYKHNQDSYWYFMDQHLFNHININKKHVHFPNPKDPAGYDALIEKTPVDLQILGIGADGHIGFNEPNTPFDEGTHITSLTQRTIKDNSRFFPSIEDVPTKAITMGLKTIMKAKEIVLIATGNNKNEAIKKLLAKVDPSCPASILNNHPNATLYLDKEAAKDIKER